MVHQWQAETGLPVDHGPGFRRKAREVGIEPQARRKVGTGSGDRPIVLPRTAAPEPPSYVQG